MSAAMSPATSAALATASLPAAILHIPANQEIFAEGEDAGTLYQVEHGLVRCCTFLADGRRHIDGFHGAGETFGLAAGRTHRLSAEAVTDCTVIAFRPGAPEGGRLAAAAMRELERARRHAMLLGRASAPEKVAAFLLERADADGQVALAMTRQDIADYLGLTIETVSRTLSQFERNGAITLETSRRVRITGRKAIEAAAGYE